MTQKQARRSERSNENDQTANDRKTGGSEARDLSAVDELLDEIDELLEDQEEIERERYKEMLKGWAARQHRISTKGHDCDPCIEYYGIQRELAQEGRHLGPPGFGDGDFIEVPCGCI